jgi:hypothetical protein
MKPNNTTPRPPCDVANFWRRVQPLHINGIYKRLTDQQAESDARFNGRLDAIESKLDAILQAAGLVPELPAMSSDVVEVLDSDMQPMPTSTGLSIAEPPALPSKPARAGKAKTQ